MPDDDRFEDPNAGFSGEDYAGAVSPAQPLVTGEIEGNLKAETSSESADFESDEQGHASVSNEGSEADPLDALAPENISTEAAQTEYEDVDGFEPTEAAPVEAVGTEDDPVVDAYYGSTAATEAEEDEEFFGLIASVVGPALKAAAPSLIGAAVKKLGPKAPSRVRDVMQRLRSRRRRVRGRESGDLTVYDATAEAVQDEDFSESELEAFAEAIEQLEVVIGKDDRVRVTNTRATPWRRICHLSIQGKDGSRFLGTGFLIGPRTVITAGHCVYLHNHGGWAKEITVSPGRNGADKPFGSVRSTSLRSVVGWTSGRNRNYDYGAIILPQPLGNRVGAFGYGVLPDAHLLGARINIAGYPGDKPSGTLWYHGLKTKAVSPRTITYDIDTAGGQSGSPVWLFKDGKRVVVGIHTNGSSRGNSATRLVPPVYTNFELWRRAGS